MAAGYSRTLVKGGERPDSRCFLQGSPVFLWSLSTSPGEVSSENCCWLRIGNNLQGKKVVLWCSVENNKNNKLVPSSVKCAACLSHPCGRSAPTLRFKLCFCVQCPCSFNSSVQLSPFLPKHPSANGNDFQTQQFCTTRSFISHPPTPIPKDDARGRAPSSLQPR